MPPSSLGEGVNIFRKVFTVRGGGRGQKFLFWWGGYIFGMRLILFGQGHVILKSKLKLHNTSIKTLI